MRTPGAVVNLRFTGKVIGGVTGLEHVERSPHVTLRKLQQRLPPIFRYLHTDNIIDNCLLYLWKGDPPFSLDDIVEFLLYLRDRMGGEPEARATTLHRWRDLVDVVANNAKSDVLGVLFNHAT